MLRDEYKYFKKRIFFFFDTCLLVSRPFYHYRYGYELYYYIILLYTNYINYIRREYWKWIFWKNFLIFFFH